MYCDRRNEGFTLIELITVIILIGIISVYAVAKLDLSIFSQRSFHDALKSSLQFARKAAIGKRRQVCVDVSGGTVSFSIESGVPENGAVTCPAATALNLPIKDSNCTNANQVCVPSGVSLTGANFYFDAQGRASASVSFSSTGQTAVTVVQETGYVY